MRYLVLILQIYIISVESGVSIIKPDNATLLNFIYSLQANDLNIQDIEPLVNNVIWHAERILQNYQKPIVPKFKPTNENLNLLAQPMRQSFQILQNESKRISRFLRQTQTIQPRKTDNRINLYELFGHLAELVEELPQVIFCTLFVCKGSRKPSNSEIDEPNEPDEEHPDESEEPSEEQPDESDEPSEEPEEPDEEFEPEAEPDSNGEDK